MNYPLVLSSHKRIVIAPDGWFDAIGKIDADRGEIEIAISRLGERSLAWYLDAQGQFFALEWQQLLPKSPLQWFGLSRQRELYSIVDPRQITAGEVLGLIGDHKEQFEEAPNTGDLQRALLAVSPNTVLGRDFMRNYLGE
jgi:hypothetical protein